MTYDLTDYGFKDASFTNEGTFDLVTLSNQQFDAATPNTFQFLDGTYSLGANGSNPQFTPNAVADQVARLYYTTVGRAPDFGGEQYWTNIISSGQESLQTVANQFVASPEFQATYGSLSNDGFVNQLYENVLGRASDTGGETYWTDLLNSGVTRGQVAVGFSESAEHIADLYSKINTGIVFSGPAYS